MKNLRNEFPVLQQYTYLNTASSGLLYDTLLDFRQEHDLDFLIGGSKFRDTQQQFLNSVRLTVAEFFGASAKNTILTPNFSTGLNTILQDISKDQKVLLLDDDYPSINFSVRSKGFDTCYAKIDEHLEQNIKSSIEQHKPDIFIFSIVQYISGIKIDLDVIKQLKNSYPELLIIADGTQFCGTAVFNFANSGIDILGCSGYKWLLGGYGNGFLLFQDGMLDHLTPKTYIEAAKNENYDSSYTSPTARFECGHLDTFNFGSLQYSLTHLSKIGLSEIEQKIKILGSYAKEELQKLNLLGSEVVSRKNHSTILNIKGDQKLFLHLKEQDIITSLRGHGVRISLHFYNTIEDIDQLLTQLHRYR